MISVVERNFLPDVALRGLRVSLLYSCARFLSTQCNHRFLHRTVTVPESTKFPKLHIIFQLSRNDLMYRDPHNCLRSGPRASKPVLVHLQVSLPSAPRC